ncbi:MAG: hypothetical protein VX460_00940 [Planctomycetota bacterium]|nr:hypothetical protein [Planctomycetota bacterium]
MKPASCCRILIAGLVLSGAAFAQGDECATATGLPFDTPTAFDTTGATESAPNFSCVAGAGDDTSRDVWFEFTALASYTTTVTTCGTAAYDTKIEVYEGSCGSLVSVACNDDFSGCPGFTSIAEFPVVNGARYFVRIGGWKSNSFGAGTVLLEGPPPPPGDCSDAQEIVVDVPTDFDTTDATISATDFSCPAGSGDLRSRDVWFKFTATANYTAIATTCGAADYDTRIEIYEGICGALVSLGCNDDSPGCAAFTSKVAFSAVNGTEYLVRIGGSEVGDFGSGQILITGPPPDVPNDECIDAIGIASGEIVSFDTTSATPSVGAPARSCGGSGAPIDVWYSFLALADGPASVSTCNLASYDSVLEIYSGDCGSLVPVTCNDDGPGCSGFSSDAHFNATAGTTYFVRVFGYNQFTGAGHLFASYPDAVANDDCSSAFPIGIGETHFSSVGAVGSSVNIGCVSGGELSDVWFSHVALNDLPLTVDLSGSSFDTGLAVWEGDCAVLKLVGCDDDGGTGTSSLLSFMATAGTTYFIQIGGFNGLSGDGVIKISEDISSIVCHGNPNSTGVGAILKASGSPVVAENDLTLNVSHLPRHQFLMFVNSRETIFVASPGGSEGDLCIGSLTLCRHVNDIVNSGPTGTVSLALDLANMPTNTGRTAVVAGETWYWQGWYRDIGYGGVPTSNLSSAIGVTFK